MHMRYDRGCNDAYSWDGIHIRNNLQNSGFLQLQV